MITNKLHIAQPDELSEEAYAVAISQVRFLMDLENRQFKQNIINVLRDTGLIK